MLAAGILVFVIVGLMGTFVSGSLLGISSRSVIIAATDAQHVMEKLKDLPYDDMQTDMDVGADFTNLPNEAVSIRVSTSSNKKSVVANVTWTEGLRQRNYELTTNVTE